MSSGGLEIWVSWTSFQKSSISWPQQPPIGKVLKFNMIFHDSTKINFVSKHQINAEFKNLDNTEASRHHDLTKLLILLPFRADLLCTLHYETHCIYSLTYVFNLWEHVSYDWLVINPEKINLCLQFFLVS